MLVQSLLARTPTKCVEKAKLSVFHRPTFGYAVRLGELFDKCTNQFLGVQLYDEEAMKENVLTNLLDHAHLTLSPSNSINDKSRILGLDDSNALDVLGDLFEVRGSCCYLR
ncbi:hypothetical protein V8B97DRAFT_308608, partial [Scleroderma yunnanense]